jgi:hypothetical protein
MLQASEWRMEGQGHSYDLAMNPQLSHTFIAKSPTAMQNKPSACLIQCAFIVTAPCQLRRRQQALVGRILASSTSCMHVMAVLSTFCSQLRQSKAQVPRGGDE